MIATLAEEFERKASLKDTHAFLWIGACSHWLGRTRAIGCKVADLPGPQVTVTAWDGDIADCRNSIGR